MGLRFLLTLKMGHMGSKVENHQFRALLSANNHKIYDLLLSKFLFITFILLLRKESSLKGIMNDELLLFGEHLNGYYIFICRKIYSVLNKALQEKVVEMSTKRRQYRNNPDVFCYICNG